jgi:copper oxidase (laccase) domain-containing protein
MAERWSTELDDGRMCRVVWSDASDGDFEARSVSGHPADLAALEARRQAIVAKPWSWLDQVHGTVVKQVDVPGEHAGDEGDGLWTQASDCPLSVTTADCAPLVLVAAQGCAVVHAGWRGLLGGIVAEAAEALAVAGPPRAALLGPCISPAAYEFGTDDLAVIERRFGPAVVGRTASGTPALDLPAAVGAACVEAGWPEPPRPSCTSDTRWFSHRSRVDRGRQATVCWLESPS